MRRILVTGALGQIGSELVPALRQCHGADRVVVSDIRMRQPGDAADDELYEHVDCTRLHQIQEAVRRYDVGTIYHLAALLSAAAEDRPQIAWQLNMGGIYDVLEVARQFGCAVFYPSSIGVYGPTTPRENTPQDTIQRPTTIYGITKVAGELLCDYYVRRFGVDARGLRLPGLISYATAPGGGTTDYAVEMFHQAVRYKRYTCFLRPDTRLDMMYMPDAIAAIMRLMDADAAKLTHRNAFNVTAMQFTPAELAAEIGKHIEGFGVDYDIDPVRQAIADSWPRSLDDSAARAEWGWRPRYDMPAMVADMIRQIRAKLRPAIGPL